MKRLLSFLLVATMLVGVLTTATLAAQATYSNYEGSWSWAGNPAHGAEDIYSELRYLEILSATGNMVTFSLIVEGYRMSYSVEYGQATISSDGTAQCYVSSGGSNGVVNDSAGWGDCYISLKFSGNNIWVGVGTSPNTYDIMENSKFLNPKFVPVPNAPDVSFKDAIGGFKTSPKAGYTVGLFTDVNENQWYGTNNQGVIKKAYELGIMGGRGNGVFQPTGNLTLGEAVKMAAVVHNIYNGHSGNFQQGTPWFQVYVDYAIANGIISPGGFSNYGKVATRAEMAYIFSRCVPQWEFAAINEVNSLPDVSKGSQYSDNIFML